jgi:hypothetical protein
VLSVNEPRAICTDCGHVRSWHDRDAARAVRSGELASDWRCYREIGGASCRCSGFRDSGELAVIATPAPAGRSVITALLLLLLLIVLVLGLLYAYRSKTPAVRMVDLHAGDPGDQRRPGAFEFRSTSSS